MNHVATAELAIQISTLPFYFLEELMFDFTLNICSDQKFNFPFQYWYTSDLSAVLSDSKGRQY